MSTALSATAAQGTGAALAEVGPRRKLVCGGARLRPALVAAGLPFEAGRVFLRDGLATWGLAADEALLMLPTDGGQPTPPDLAATLRAAGAAVTEVGAGLVELRLAGHGARALLAELCAVDLSERALDEGAIVQAPMANVRVVLARQDRGGEPGFTLLVARDLAAYLVDVIIETGLPHRVRIGPQTPGPAGPA